MNNFLLFSPLNFNDDLWMLYFFIINKSFAVRLLFPRLMMIAEKSLFLFSIKDSS